MSSTSFSSMSVLENKRGIHPRWRVTSTSYSFVFFTLSIYFLLWAMLTIRKRSANLFTQRASILSWIWNPDLASVMCPLYTPDCDSRRTLGAIMRKVLWLILTPSFRSRSNFEWMSMWRASTQAYRFRPRPDQALTKLLFTLALVTRLNTEACHLSGFVLKLLHIRPESHRTYFICVLKPPKVLRELTDSLGSQLLLSIPSGSPFHPYQNDQFCSNRNNMLQATGAWRRLVAVHIFWTV